MKIQKFEGLVAAPYTPMDVNANIDLKEIDKYANHLINSRLEGAFICGTTGESFSLTTDERKLILESWIKNSRKELKIICHVGSNCLTESIDLASHAQKSGAYAVGCIAPMFFKPKNAEEIIAFFAPIAESAPDIPFYYYHFPSLTGVDIKASDVIALASTAIPNFGGVKFTHSDFYDMQKCIAFGDGRYNILNGFDEMLLCGLSLGVNAAVGSTFNFMPSIYLSIWDSFSKGDFKKARELQQFSVRVVDILVKYRGALVAGKSIMELIGINCGPCRLPLKSLSESEKALLKRDLQAINFFEIIDKN